MNVKIQKDDSVQLLRLDVWTLLNCTLEYRISAPIAN